MLCARGEERLAEALTELRAANPDADAATVSADLATAAGAARAVEATVAAFGRLDVLVNDHNDDNHAEFADLGDDAFLDQLQAKPIGYLRLCWQAAQVMRPQGSGVILNVIGVPAKQSVGPPWYPLGLFTESALAGFTKSIADELGPAGIRVVAVHPGPIRTPRSTRFIGIRAEQMGITPEAAMEAWARGVPLRRFAEPSEVADVIVFLCSERAGFVTGTSLVVDGGLTRAIT
jgi:3-oxoacyl-[acyl-carrier protein] reductase